jgi:glycine/D-amino acid oxidase-like deaminating enzyme
MKTIWLGNQAADIALPLDHDIFCDVAVIGAGIAGVSAAYHLNELGLKVAIFEKDGASSGSTGQSGGFLASSTTFDFCDLIDRWEEKNGRRIFDSISSSIKSIEDTVKKHGISCGFKKCGAFYVAGEKSDFSLIKREHETLVRFGYKSELYNPGDPRIPATANFGALKTFSDCAFNPAEFVSGLLDVLKLRGIQVFKGKITGIREEKDLVFLSSDNNHSIKAKFVVLATNGFSLSGRPLPAALQYRSHILVTKPVSGIRERWNGELIWDTYKMYHYLRLLDDGRILIGGEDSLFARREAELKDIEKKNRHLLGKLREFFPGLKIEADFGWTGQLSYPLDGLPIIKTEGKVTSLITDGIPFGWLVGQMAADRISKGKSELDDLYDYGRDYGLLRNIIIKSRLPNFLKYFALKLGLFLEHIGSSLDEKFKN